MGASVKKIDFEKEYTNWKIPGSFSGAKNFYKHLKQNYKNITYKSVKNWLASFDTYTLHKNVKKKNKTLKNSSTWSRTYFTN